MGKRTPHTTLACCQFHKKGTTTQDSFGQPTHEEKNQKKSCAQVVACMKKLDKSLKKASKKAENIAVMRRVTAIPISVRSGSKREIKIVIRKLKLNDILQLTLPQF